MDFSRGFGILREMVVLKDLERLRYNGRLSVDKRMDGEIEVELRRSIE